VKFNFRKIASVIASTVMLSSTVALAAAANYPAPFVQNSVADVAVVYGANAAQTDLVAATDITTDLNSKVLSTVTNTAATSVSGGDFVKLERPSSKLHLGGTMADVFTRAVTSDDLPKLLADGVYTDGNNNDHDYDQKITPDAGLTLGLFSDSDYKADTPTIGFKVADGAKILTYKLEFTSNNPAFADLDNSDIVIMGKTYRVIGHTGTNSVTLLDSANSGIVKEGETNTISAGGKNYDVSISSISGSADDPKVKLTVAGETTNSLVVGDTYKLKSSGLYVGIKDISIRDVAGNVGSVEFSIGSGKIVLTDTDEVEVNENTVTGLKAIVTADGADLKDLGFEWDADGSQFITPDSSITLPTFDSVKLSFGGMVFPASEDINVKNDGRYAAELVAPIKDGDATIDLLHTDETQDSNATFQDIGKDATHLLVTSAGDILTFDKAVDYDFVASWNDDKDSESYLLYVTDFVTNNGVDQATLKKRNDDSYSKVIQKDDVVSLGSVELTVTDLSRADGTVEFTAGDGTSFDKLFTKEGLQIALPVDGQGGLVLNDNSSYNLVMTEANKDGTVAGGDDITVALGVNSKGQVTVTDATAETPTESFEIGDSQVYVSYDESALATEIQHDTSPDQETATITYHGSESYGELVLSDVSAYVTSGGSSGKVIAITDAEAATTTANNLVVVGGSCINSVAATLLGGAYCGADFEAKTGVGAGSYLIETFAHGTGGVATLVAGYNADDTTNAAKAFTTQQIDTTVGKKYTGTTATAVTPVLASS